MTLMNRRAILSTGAAALFTGPAFAAATPAKHQARIVKTRGGFAPHEIHVDPGQFALYWTLPDGRAIRYPVGIGTADRYAAGVFRVGRQAAWPRWTPTKNMIRREPHLYAKHAGGMPGGPGNPLGAHALYLYRGSRDTLLRIHGTPDPRGIGQAISNGCVRMLNAHVVDLAKRVPNGTRVVLH